MAAKDSLFDINKLYVLESTQTNAPYVDENGASHIFIHKEDAEKDAENYEDVRISDPKFYTMAVMGKLCYSAGADAFNICVDGKSETIPIREQDLEIAYYNHALNRSLALIKQHKLPKDLCSITLCDFLVPAQVRQEESDIQIVYCVAKHTQTDMETLYLAFSSLNEFALWSMDNPGWKVIQADYKKLRGICGKNGFMINPSGNRLIVSAKMLQRIDNITAHANVSPKTPEKERENK